MFPRTEEAKLGGLKQSMVRINKYGFNSNVRLTHGLNDFKKNILLDHMGICLRKYNQYR